MAIRRRLLQRRQRALEGAVKSRYLFGLLGQLRLLSEVTGSSFLQQIFRRVPGPDDRRGKYLWSAPRPNNYACSRVDLLEDDLIQFVDGIRQSTQGATQTVLKLSLSDEAKLGRKILGTSAKLHMQVFRQLKPVFALQETFIEKRKKVPYLSLKKKSHLEMLEKFLRNFSENENEDCGFNLEYDERIGDDQEVGKPVDLPEPIEALRAPAVIDPSSEVEIRSTTESYSSSQLMEWLEQFRLCISGASDIIDLYLLASQCQLVALAIAELMEQSRVYASAMAAMINMSSQFVRLGLPLLDQLFSPVCSSFVKENIFPLSFTGIARGPYWQPARQLIRKTSLLDDILAGLDIVVLPSRIAAHDGGIKAIGCGHLNSDYIVTGGADGLCRIWDTKTGSCHGQLVGHSSCITWCSFSQYDAQIYSTSFDGTLRIWNSRTATCETILTGHQDAILHGAISNDFRRLASASMDCTVRIWETRSGKCTHVLNGHQGWVKCVAFGNYGHQIVTGGLDNKVHIWVLTTTSSAQIKHTIHSHKDFILDLATCLSPALLITCSKDQTVKVWNMVNGQSERDLKSREWIRTLQISPDESMVATGSFDNCISIFRISSGRLLRKIRVHNSGILKLAWTTNRTIICATTDGYLQIIDI